jgi:hypothetical protein
MGVGDGGGWRGWRWVLGSLVLGQDIVEEGNRILNALDADTRVITGTDVHGAGGGLLGTHDEDEVVLGDLSLAHLEFNQGRGIASLESYPLRQTHCTHGSASQ